MKKLLSLVALATFLQAETMQFTEYVAVSSATPQYQRVSQSIPYQECSNVPIQQVSQRSSHDNVAGSIIGGAIGGILGHQVGRGKGNDAATIGGAILGTIVGGNVIGGNQGYQEPVSYQTRQNCTTRYRQSQGQRQLTGYENVAYYKGKRIVKYANQRLSSIPVTVTIDY